MNDIIQPYDENEEKAEKVKTVKNPKAKAVKNTKVAQRPPQRKAIEGSRIMYKDRHKLKAFGRDDKKYVYRTANSDDGTYAGRVEDLKSMGYTVCNDNESLGDDNGTEASSIGSVIGKPVGNGVRGVLMRQLRTNYEEDQRQKQAEVDETEKGMVDDELLKSDDMYGEGLRVNRGPTVKIQHN